LIKFIRARKLEVGPAIALLKAGVVYRRENNLENIKVTDVLAVRTPLSPLSPIFPPPPKTIPLKC